MDSHRPSLELNVIPAAHTGGEVVTHIWSVELKAAPLGHAGFDSQRFVDESNEAFGEEHVGGDEEAQ